MRFMKTGSERTKEWRARKEKNGARQLSVLLSKDAFAELERRTAPFAGSKKALLEAWLTDKK